MQVHISRQTYTKFSKFFSYMVYVALVPLFWLSIRVYFSFSIVIVGKTKES